MRRTESSLYYLLCKRQRTSLAFARQYRRIEQRLRSRFDGVALSP